MIDDPKTHSRPVPWDGEPTRPIVRQVGGPPPTLSHVIEAAALIHALKEIVTTCDDKTHHTQDRVLLVRMYAAEALQACGVYVAPAPRSTT